MKEIDLVKKIMVKASKLGLRLFRNNTGTGWTGKKMTVSKPTQVLITPQDIVLRNFRPLHTGLCKGSSDTIGWAPVTITEDMVGKRVAVFLGWEFKTLKGRASEFQKNFIDKVNEDGGIGVITYGEDQALDFLEKFDV